MVIESKLVPEWIKIQNFNNIADLEIDWKNIVIVTGKNGSGKTSIAEAIDFCLTGQIMRGVKMGDIITVGKKFSEVTIKGKFAGEPIEITRRRTTTTQKLSVILGDGNKRREVENASDYLDNIINHTEFETLYYFNGHNLSTFINSSAETTKMLDKIFSIDLLDSIVSETGKAINMISKREEITKASIGALQHRKETYDQLKTMEDPAVAYQAEIDEINESMPALREKLAGMTPNRDALEKKSREIDGTLRSMDQEARIKQELESRENDAKKKISDIETRENDLSEKLKGDAPIEEIKKNLEDLKSRYSATKARIDVLREMPLIFEKVLNTAEEKTECPVCFTPGKKDVAVENLKDLKKKAQLEMVDLLKGKKRLETEIADLEQASQSKQNVVMELQKVSTTKSIATSGLKEIQKKIGEIKEIDIKEVERLRGEKEKVDDEIQMVTRTIIQAETSIDEQRKRLEILKRKVDAGMQVRVTWTDVEEKELDSQNKMMDVLSRKKDKLINIRSVFKEILSSIRERIMDAINPEIMEKIKSFGMENTPITSFSIVPRTRTTKGDVYNYYDFNVKIKDEELAFNSLSTGQKALSIISVILSMINFSESSLSALIFDEIDNCGLDKENLKVVLDSVVNLSRKMRVVFINRDKQTIDYIETVANKKVGITKIEMPDPLAMGKEGIEE